MYFIHIYNSYLCADLVYTLLQWSLYSLTVVLKKIQKIILKYMKWLSVNQLDYKNHGR